MTLTKQQIKKEILKKGFVKFNEYFCFQLVQLTSEQVDMPAQFEKQLHEEQYYGAYIGHIVNIEDLKLNEKIEFNGIVAPARGFAKSKNIQHDAETLVDTILENDILKIVESINKMNEKEELRKQQ